MGCFLPRAGKPHGGGTLGGTYAAAKGVCLRKLPQLQGRWCRDPHLQGTSHGPHKAPRGGMCRSPSQFTPGAQAPHDDIPAGLSPSPLLSRRCSGHCSRTWLMLPAWQPLIVHFKPVSPSRPSEIKRAWSMPGFQVVQEYPF